MDMSLRRSRRVSRTSFLQHQWELQYPMRQDRSPMTVDRPTPISSGYLKAFSTGQKTESGSISVVRGWRVESTGSLLSSPLPRPQLLQRISAEIPAHKPHTLHLACDSDRSSSALLKNEQMSPTQFCGAGYVAGRGVARNKEILLDAFECQLLFRVLAGD